MPPAVECHLDHAPGNTVGTADQLDNDIDLRIGCHGRRVLVPADRGQIDSTIAAPIAGGDRRDNDPAASTLSQQIGLAVEQLQGSCTDRTETRDGDLQRRFHDSEGKLRIGGFRDISRRVAAWRQQTVYLRLAYPEQ